MVCSETVTKISLDSLDKSVELSRLACQQGIRTPVSNTRELFRQGGVGGLLRDSADVAVMSQPKHPTMTELAS
ncbi:MAG: hypothetical protein AB2535_19595 [Candidatus Thiodiazotropha endolucinida]